MKTHVKADIEFPLLNLNIFKKTLAQRLLIEQRNAARVWLREVLKHIPSYTGTSRGTLKPLGRALRVAVPKLQPGGNYGDLAAAARKKYFIYKGVKYPLGFEQGASYSDFSFTVKTGIKFEYKFVFTNNLLYNIWNDIMRAPNWLNLRTPTPWESLDKGAIAWNDYVKNIIPTKIPKFAEATKKFKIKVR